jgi:hypothetical protein
VQGYLDPRLQLVHNGTHGYGDVVGRLAEAKAAMAGLLSPHSALAGMCALDRFSLLIVGCSCQHNTTAVDRFRDSSMASWQWSEQLRSTADRSTSDAHSPHGKVLESLQACVCRAANVRACDQSKASSHPADGNPLASLQLLHQQRLAAVQALLQGSDVLAVPGAGMFQQSPRDSACTGPRVLSKCVSNSSSTTAQHGRSGSNGSDSSGGCSMGARESTPSGLSISSFWPTLPVATGAEFNTSAPLSMMDNLDALHGNLLREQTVLMSVLSALTNQVRRGKKNLLLLHCMTAFQQQGCASSGVQTMFCHLCAYDGTCHTNSPKLS